MNQLTPIQEMAAKDLFIVRAFLERTPGSRYFEGLNSRYRWILSSTGGIGVCPDCKNAGRPDPLSHCGYSIASILMLQGSAMG